MSFLYLGIGWFNIFIKHFNVNIFKFSFEHCCTVTQLVPFDILWHLFSIDRKRVTENTKISFDIFEISNSFFDCLGNSPNPHGIYKPS